jgi:hypothetical protein
MRFSRWFRDSSHHHYGMHRLGRSWPVAAEDTPYKHSSRYCTVPLISKVESSVELHHGGTGSDPGSSLTPEHAYICISEPQELAMTDSCGGSRSLIFSDPTEEDRLVLKCRRKRKGIMIVILTKL